MGHQLPSEFTAGIMDYKQHMNILLINAYLVQWLGRKIAGKETHTQAKIQGHTICNLQEVRGRIC